MYKAAYGCTASAKVLTFLKCKLVHAIWLLLLTDDFVNAYTLGIVVPYMDGVSRRLFPQFFTYSADYPEKCVHSILCSISANKFWTESPLPQSNTLDIAYVHFVCVLRRKYKTWVQGQMMLNEIIFGWIQSCDKGWLKLHKGGYSRKGNQSLQNWLTGFSISWWSPFM